MLVSFEPRVIIKYTLLDCSFSHPVRFRPYLAFRSVNELTYANPQADTSYEEVKNGISMRLYAGYPHLFMQFSKKNSYTHQPDWYKNIMYYKEKERGYAYKEDLMVPGFFEMPIKKGESVVFSAGITEISPLKLKKLWETELLRRNERADMFSTLKKLSSAVL